MERPANTTEGKWNDLQENPIQEGIDDAVKYGDEATEVCRYRSFFITKRGKFGLGPGRVLPGLSVYLIHGLRTPFLVQKAEDEGDYIRGECYVEDLVNDSTGDSEGDGYVDLVLK
jgi:hypothetical protein